MDHTRRTFVLASAALLPAQSPNDTVRVAFIGVGNRGGYLLNTMLKVPGVKVVAICDIDPENLKKAMDAASRGRPRAGGLHRIPQAARPQRY